MKKLFYSHILTADCEFRVKFINCVHSCSKIKKGADCPIDIIPYSKEMYYDGVNLNNINDINYKELKKLKRKVLKLERRNNHE